jgi:ribulose kinase
VRAAVAEAKVSPDSIAAICLDTTNCTVVALDAGVYMCMCYMSLMLGDRQCAAAAVVAATCVSFLACLEADREAQRLGVGGDWGRCRQQRHYLQEVLPDSIAAICQDLMHIHSTMSPSPHLTSPGSLAHHVSEGQPLRPALLWMDMRSADQAAQVLATGDIALEVNSGGRGPVSAEWMIGKALWIKQNAPELYKVCCSVSALLRPPS